MTNGASPSSTVPDRCPDPPDDGEQPECSWCGRVADRELTPALFACSVACEAELMHQWCAWCHAHVADGEDHAADCEAVTHAEEMADEHADLDRAGGWS